MNDLWVVGDRFASFAALSGVLRLEALHERIARLRAGAPAAAETQRLRLGMGLSWHEVVELAQLVALPEVAGAFVLEDAERARPCAPELVHKRQLRNVMLTRPEARGEGHFVARLRLDDDCDDLADHLTGHHIQGAVLAEAARQMVLAVSESFLLPEPKRFGMRFVTHALEFHYHAYAFPLEVQIELRTEHMKRGAGGNFAATAVIACTQNDVAVADGRFRYSALDGAFVDGNESALAQRAIRTPT